MENKNISNSIVNAVLKLSLIAFGVFIFLKLNIVLIYFIVAAVISLIGRPIVIFLEEKLKFRKLFAALFALLFLVSLIFGLISLIIPLILKQGENLSLLNLKALENNLNQLMIEISNYFNLDSFNNSRNLNSILNIENLEAIPNFLNYLLSLLGSFTAGLFSVMFISFFLLKDSRILENTILLLVNDKNQEKLEKSIEKIKNLLSRYFLGLLLQISILLIFYTIVLTVFSIENAFVIAFLCALLNLIPYIGPLIGIFLMMFLTMTSNIGADFSTVILPKTIYVLIGFIIGQLIDNIFSQPYIFSNSVKSHPLEIFIVIITGGTLLGTTGMIVAIPLYTSLKVILKEFLFDNKIVKSITKDI